MLNAALRGKPTTAAWFLASACADAADLLGGLVNHSRMTRAQQVRGLGGAGIGIGLIGAARARSR